MTVIRIKTEQEDQVNNFESNSKDVKIKNTYLCAICCKRQRYAMFMPCFHLAACVTCCVNIQKCPICSLSIDGVFNMKHLLDL